MDRLWPEVQAGGGEAMRLRGAALLAFCLGSLVPPVHAACEGVCAAWLEQAEGDGQSALAERIRLYRKVLKEDPRNYRARRGLAEITIQGALAIERAQALEREGEVRAWSRRIAAKLGDTAWRVGFMARKGDARAETAMGVLHRMGLLVERDPVKACRHYRRASALGEPSGLYRYALCMAKEDREEAIRLVEKAAAAGHAAAQHLLGETYLHGPQRDPEKASAWIRRAARAGRPSAKSLLAWLYDTGTGVPEDKGRAFRLYLEAAREGNLSACNNLGEMYETGSAGIRDLSKAARWYRRGAEGGLAQAQFNLGRLYADGKGVTRNDALARRWFEQAAQQGLEPAREALKWLSSQDEQSHR
ncbi:MAG: hypothetical protein D6819_03355 [Gammaproteobacteria bacterium]|nr:MAG: hypothetical protein D6819_03355 [Gammaproteobacteria bacterium]